MEEATKTVPANLKQKIIMYNIKFPFFNFKIKAKIAFQN